MDYIVIGKIVNTFGIKGELKIESYSDFEDERFAHDSKIYIGEDHICFTIDFFRRHKGFVLLKLQEVNNINLVEKYKNMYIYKSKDDIKPLTDGFYFSDLCNLEVFVNNVKIGKVIRVEKALTSNNLRIRKYEDGKQYLVPFLDVFVTNVDLDNKRIDIVDMEGLL